MYRIIADYMTIGIWGVSVSNTIAGLNLESSMGVVQFFLSMLGLVYLLVKIINETKNGIVDREGKRIENEAALKELLDEQNEEITK